LQQVCSRFSYQRLLSCLIILSFAACAKPEPSADIRFAIAQAPLNLDPRYATDAASERINRLLYHSLVDFDTQSKPVPSLATWVQVSPTQFRFTLRQAIASFHNGVPMQASDVVATYQSLLALRDSPHTAEFVNINKIQIVNNYTVDFTLTYPDANFPARLVIGILPASLLAQKHDFSHQPVGNGALKFVSWRGVLKLVRVSDGQLFTLSEVKDPTVRILKLQRGEADLLAGDLSPELVRYLKQKKDIHVIESIGENYSYLGLNLQDALLKNPKVRQAIAHSIDRKAMIRQVLVGGSREAGAILPPEHWAGNSELKPYNYNPALSRQLLQQAGIKLPLTLVYKTSTDPQRVRLATVMQAQMAEAGIDLQIKSLDWGTFFDDVKQGHFQLYGLTWVGIKTPEIYAKAFGTEFTPPNGFNRGRYSDATADALLAKGDWHAATQRIHQQLPYIPLWYEGQFAAMSQDLAGYQIKADGNWDGLVSVHRQ
jgi:peptide/nickel transport system substrate-binding protein